MNAILYYIIKYNIRLPVVCGLWSPWAALSLLRAALHAPCSFQIVVLITLTNILLQRGDIWNIIPQNDVCAKNLDIRSGLDLSGDAMCGTRSKAPIDNESNWAIHWGCPRGIRQDDSQEVVAGIGSCPLHLPLLCLLASDYMYIWCRAMSTASSMGKKHVITI